uniref:Peptidase S8/S53 domain-containing protein n=1 Tax=Bionectria ochroleuca TaxID=29856 RepID=A0A8H7NJL0_BIOOC
MRSSLLLAALPLAVASPVRQAPLYTRDGEDAIEGKYIVVMKAGAQVSSVDSAVGSIAANADYVYNNLGGFSASLTDAEVESLRNDPSVSYIQQNAKASIFATQENAPWGLARLSNKSPGSTTYTYKEGGGEGVCVYVVDTGIDIEHPDFGGRATWVATVFGDVDYDDHSHGTHCAGTVAGTQYGVAKKASLYAIKAFDGTGDGSDASMIAGMEKVLEDAPNRDCPNGVVVSMSFGGGKTQAVNDAAKALVDAGYFAAAAAGNGDFLNRPIDAGTVSPASEVSLCTVGATDSEDVTAYFSNYGSVVDIFGPGVSVESDIPNGGTGVKSGTSMATPHIAGLGAYFLSQGKAASGLCEYLQSIALQGIISDVRSGTVNLLAQNGEASA